MVMKIFSSFLRDLFHRGDRAMIYLFIAGSYTPWLHLRNPSTDQSDIGSRLQKFSQLNGIHKEMPYNILKMFVEKVFQLV